MVQQLARQHAAFLASDPSATNKPGTCFLPLIPVQNLCGGPYAFLRQYTILRQLGAKHHVPLWYPC